jgi:LmbE family N-acetylglucosaminyl deacetylase
MGERPGLFVSPHLDDAVFACGACIAASPKSVVVTVFAGRPEAGASLTTWDAECGFTVDDDVVAIRRGEDRAALDVLDARPVWLDFRDAQYGEPRNLQEIGEALAGVIECQAKASVYLPLGLFHSDHHRASDAALALVDRFPTLDWHAYEDAIYRRIPGAVDARLRVIRDAGFALERCTRSGTPDCESRKRSAVLCYASQLGALATRPAHTDVLATEAYWRIAVRAART